MTLFKKKHTILSSFLTISILSSFPSFASGTSSDMPGLVEKATSTEITDKFDFLPTQFPRLKKRLNDQYINEPEDNSRYYTWGYRGPDEALAGIKDKLKMNILGTEMLTKAYPGQPSDILELIVDGTIQQLKCLQKRHSQEGFFKVYFDRIFKKHHCIEEIVLSAEYLYQKIINNNDENPIVLFLGRTPCTIQLAYEEILKATGNKSHQVVHVNFSGHPDAETLRDTYYYQSDEFRIRNLVTPERLAHYFRYLDSKNICKNKKIYIVDTIGHGNGFNSFVRVLNSYFESRAMPEPQLCFMALSGVIERHRCDEGKVYSIATDKPYGENEFVITYKGIKNLNLKPLVMPTHLIPCNEDMCKMILDHESFQDVAVHGIEYPAQKWTPEFDAEIERGGVLKNRLYHFLRENFVNFIAFHMKAVGMASAQQ